jgi:hypothetical protein
VVSSGKVLAPDLNSSISKKDVEEMKMQVQTKEKHVANEMRHRRNIP